jgi:hypothetical protein
LDLLWHHFQQLKPWDIAVRPVGLSLEARFPTRLGVSNHDTPE